MGNDEQTNMGADDREIEMMATEAVAQWIAEVCGRSLGEGIEAQVRAEAILLLSGVLERDGALLERRPAEVTEEVRAAIVAVLPFARPMERPLRMPVQPLETLVDGLLQPMPLLQPAV